MRPGLANLAVFGALLRASAGALALLTVFSIPAEAAAQAAGASSGATEERYRRLIADAVAEFELAHWEEAVVLFREAHQLRPSVKTHRGLGQALFEARDYVHAIPHLRAALTAPHGTFGPQEQDLLEHALDQALRFVGRVNATLQPPDAVVLVDGNVVDPTDGFLLNPGEHMLVATAGGYHPFQQSLDVEGGSTQTLQIVLVSIEAAKSDPVPTDGDGARAALPEGGESAPPATSLHEDSPSSVNVPATLGWISAGLAVSALTAGVVTWRLRDDGPVADWKQQGCETAPMLDASCRDLQSDADALQLASVLSTVAGGLFGVTAIVLFVVAADDGPEQGPSAGFSCAGGLGSFACAGRF